MIDIRERDDLIELINSSLNSGSILEIKTEGKDNVVVVEITRQVKTKKVKK